MTGPTEPHDTTNLCWVLSKIREVTGVGGAPMLDELPDAIKAAIAEQRRAATLAAFAHAERIWRGVQYSPAPYTDGLKALRALVEGVG